MKLVFVLVVAAVLQVSAGGYAQKITLSQKNISLEHLFWELSTQTGYQFICDADLIKGTKPKDVDFKNIPLEVVLNECLSEESLTYTIKRNAIIIRPLSARAKQLSLQKIITITGKVTDAQGIPLPGVSIKLKGTTTGTITDSNGSFTMNVPDETAILVFSFIGFKSQEVPIAGRNPINISLLEDISTLNEAVVIGYGTSTKADLVGSVGTVSISDMEKAPVGSFTEALAGRVAGVQVSANDGQPGGPINIIIRGASSLTQSNAPLYVIDGFASENPESAALNTDDIESISVLKDATATAIYGSRAANGVVVITTKKGKIGAPVISINSLAGFQGGVKTMEVMNPYEFVKYQVELGNALNLPAAGAARYLINDRTLDFYKGIEGINWQEQLFRQGVTQIHNIALRGGTEKTKYSISGSIFDQEGVIINTAYDKYQTRISLDQVVNKKFSVGLNANYAFQHTSGTQVASNPASSTSQISAILLFRGWGYRPVAGSPDFDLLNSMADIDNYSSAGEPLRILNPVVSTMNEYQHFKKHDLIGNLYLKYDFSKSLSLRVTGAVNPRIERRDQFYNSQTPQGSPLNPANVKGISGAVNYYSNNSFENVNTLTYNQIFKNDHSLSGVAGFSITKSSYDIYGYQAQNLPNEGLGIVGLNEGIANNQLAVESSNGMQSFFGRLSYNYKSKYYLEGNVRIDGSSKFYKTDRWGYFPSVGASWRMDKESFIEDMTFISNSKLRASYGHTGNNRISDFAYLPALTSGLLTGVSFNNKTPGTGVIPAGLANQDLKWETTKILNLGYDLGLFKERLGVTIDWYKKITQDLLLNAALPPTVGFGSVLKNIGSVKNTGLEISLNSVNIKNASFMWSSSFNISFNKNKILELTRGQRTLYSNVGHEDGQMIFCLKTAYVETDEQNTDGKPATQLLRTELRAVYGAKSQYSGGKEVILMDMVGRGDVLVLAENFRFDDDGNKKLTFREGEVLMPDKDGTTAIPIFGRAATMEGMHRFLTENTVKFQDIKIVMWPAHESIDEVESTPAAIDQREYIQDMMDQNLNVMQCLHCGKIISTNDSYSVEIDEEGLKPNAGNVHKECLRPADRMVGRAIRPEVEQTQLINFDFGKWIELLMTGQGFITGALKSAAKFSGAVISWNRDHYHNSGDYCVRMILEDGSFNYLTIGKDIHRFSASEIDEELTKLNSEVGIFGKLSITKTFGTVEFLNSIKLGEEVVIPVVKYEKIRYSNQLETKMAKLANDYAPLGLVLDEENKIVRFGDIVPLITDPFTFDELHANWNESGFIDKPCNMQILESDKDVNYYLMIFFGDDLIPVLNPRFASDQSLSSGISIRQMSEIIKNADKRLE